MIIQVNHHRSLVLMRESDKLFFASVLELIKIMMFEIYLVPKERGGKDLSLQCPKKIFFKYTWHEKKMIS